MEEYFNNIREYLDQILERIKNKSDFKLVEEGFVIRDHRVINIDAMLIINESPLVVFEFQKTVASLNRQEVVNVYEKTNFDCRYFVLSNGIQSKIYDTYFGNVENAKDFTEFWSILFVELDSIKINILKEKIVDEIKKEVFTFQKQLKGIKNTLKSYELENKFQNLITAVNLFGDRFSAHLKYDIEGRFFYITNDLRNFDELENQFFKTIIEEVPRGTEIYRYTME